MSNIIIATQYSTAGIFTRRVGLAVYNSVAESTYSVLRESVWNSIRLPIFTTVGVSTNLSIEYAVGDYFKEND
jgi:hypothetical protein